MDIDGKRLYNKPVMIVALSDTNGLEKIKMRCRTNEKFKDWEKVTGYL